MLVCQRSASSSALSSSCAPPSVADGPAPAPPASARLACLAAFSAAIAALRFSFFLLRFSAFFAVFSSCGKTTDG